MKKTTKQKTDEKERRQKRLAIVLEYQNKLRAEGRCLRCTKRKANRGPGSTLSHCPECAEKGRVYSRLRYRAKQGLKPNHPKKATGRPLHKPFKA
jgi:hypothetical protein